MKPLKLKL